MDINHAPGSTFAVGLDGTVAWTQGFGLADVENRVRGSPDTEYRSASIGKSMTATVGLFNLENIPGKERIELAEAIADVILGEKTPNVIKYLK